jgi:hypothetical protein
MEVPSTEKPACPWPLRGRKQLVVFGETCRLGKNKAFFAFDNLTPYEWTANGRE